MVKETFLPLRSDGPYSRFVSKQGDLEKNGAFLLLSLFKSTPKRGTLKKQRPICIQVLGSGLNVLTFTCFLLPLAEVHRHLFAVVLSDSVQQPGDAAWSNLRGCLIWAVPNEANRILQPHFWVPQLPVGNFRGTN